jgi:hypothetical protein
MIDSTMLGRFDGIMPIHCEEVKLLAVIFVRYFITFSNFYFEGTNYDRNISDPPNRSITLEVHANKLFLGLQHIFGFL